MKKKMPIRAKTLLLAFCAPLFYTSLMYGITLDEATNSLDTINEKKIVDALNSAFENRTVVVVAHRLSTIRNADQIIVLDKGCVVEIGNHNSLMERKGYYYNLVASQAADIS